MVLTDLKRIVQRFVSRHLLRIGTGKVIYCPLYLANAMDDGVSGQRPSVAHRKVIMTGNISNVESDPDFTKAAADHLRFEAKQHGLKIGSSHAHALVAAWLGYQSRIALLSPSSDHYTSDPWLFREKPNRDQLDAAIARMRSGNLKGEHVPFLVRTICDGLAPPCSETGLHSAFNIPLGYVEKGDDVTGVEWVHPSEAKDRERFDHCLCCGHNFLYRNEDLDKQQLCKEHEGELDLDEEEQDGWNDLGEYLTKDS